MCRSHRCGVAFNHSVVFIFTNELSAVICCCVGVRRLSDRLHFNTAPHVKKTQTEAVEFVLFHLLMKLN